MRDHRGYPLFSVHRRFGLAFAQLAVALVFAFEHWLGGWPLSRAFFGAGVGMAALTSRGLALPICMHAAFNFGTSMIGRNRAPGLWRVTPDQDARMQTATTVSCLIVVSMALVGLYLLYRRSNGDRSSAFS